MAVWQPLRRWELTASAAPGTAILRCAQHDIREAIACPQRRCPSPVMLSAAKNRIGRYTRFSARHQPVVLLGTRQFRPPLPRLRQTLSLLTFGVERGAREHSRGSRCTIAGRRETVRRWKGDVDEANDATPLRPSAARRLRRQSPPRRDAGGRRRPRARPRRHLPHGRADRDAHPYPDRRRHRPVAQPHAHQHRGDAAALRGGDRDSRPHPPAAHHRGRRSGGQVHPRRPPPEDADPRFANTWGNPDHSCVDLGQFSPEQSARPNEARSGEFIAGPFAFYMDEWPRDRKFSKMWWMPLHTDDMPGITVRAILLDDPSRTVVVRQPLVAYNEGGRFYPSEVALRDAGRWLLIVTSGHDWGCFIMPLAGA